MNTHAILASILALAGCAALQKDNHPKDPPASPVGDEVRAQLQAYRPLIKAQADSYGLARLGGSIGDSALFSCLAYAAGALDFDPAILFTADGKPIRHPEIAPGKSATPISKDMMNGIMWCLHTLGKRDKDHALDLVSKWIAFGKAHSSGVSVGWFFCTEDDKAAYKINDQDWLGKCLALPAVVKDIYRVAKEVGYPCDQDCQAWMAVGSNVPSDNDGFLRHLAVTTTTRNGLVEGGINDNSLKIVLENAAKAQPRNALYQGAYHLFGDGDQTKALALLEDPNFFPPGVLPTKNQFCTPYIFQRDDDSQSEKAEPDWMPCPDDKNPNIDQGRGIDFAFTAALVLGEIR